jgi:hypothetical protein
MGNFQVYDALSIFFELEKLLVEHLEGFILLSREGGELQIFFKTFNWKFQLKNSKEFPVGLVKAGASMVGGIFVIATMNC